MSIEKNMNTRIQHKHDTEANWNKAVNFIPKAGEIIVYDIDENYNYSRFKIGDGVRTISNLEFSETDLTGYATESYVDSAIASLVNTAPEALNTLNELASALGDDPNFAATVATEIGKKVDKVDGKGLSTNDFTTAEKNKLAGIATGANKITVDSALSSTSTNPVQNKIVNTAISNLNTLVGDTKVSSQIENAIDNYVPHWSSIEGKPFVTIGGDTLTWDGNTEGLEYVQAFKGYKVSDAVLTEENLLNASLLIIDENGEHEPTGEMTISKPFEGAIMCGGLNGIKSEMLIIVINDVVAEQIAASAGTYFLLGNAGDTYVSSLTIPGYTGFAKEQIDPKVLPDYVDVLKTKLDATNIAYGTCSTAAATAAKEITISGNTNWTLAPGSRITIKFSYTNTASNPTFNVNGTGAKSIWYNTGVLTTSSLNMAGYADRPMDFVYDGTNYIFTGWSVDSNTTYTNASLGNGYGTCSTAAATTAKVVTLSGYALSTGGQVSVKFTNAVPAGATMNINSKGAKAIWYKGKAITDGVICAGEVATFIYDGTRYHLLTVDRNRFFTSLVPMGTAIPENADLNTLEYLKVGNYYCSANAVTKTLLNCPTVTTNADGTKSGVAFMMTVSSPLSQTVDDESGTWKYRFRTIQAYNGPMYTQYCYSNGTGGNWIYEIWYQVIKSNDVATTSKAGLMSAADKVKVNGIPSVSTSDNGKFLRVVNGAWAAVTVSNAEEVRF